MCEFNIYAGKAPSGSSFWHRAYGPSFGFQLTTNHTN